MTARIAALAAALLLLPAAPGFEAFEFDTPEQESRYRGLTHELRCLVCQNQSLADSNAELAADLRTVIRDMLLDGSSDKEIVAFLLERYGDFVLYRPPLRASTALLWAGPFIALLVGLAVLAVLAKGFARSRGGSGGEQEG